MVNYFPAITSVITAIFAILLFIQYLQRRKVHQLVWTISVIMFFLSALFEFLAELFGWTDLMYRFYYVLTPLLVALMGTGSLFLLADRKWGNYFLYYTLGLCTPLFILAFTATLNTEMFARGSEIAGLAMPSYVRIFSPLMTIPGGLALIIGAIYSYWLDRTRTCNLLIAIGGMFPFIGGMMTRFGVTIFFYPFETIGAVLLFLGFLKSAEVLRGTKQD